MKPRKANKPKWQTVINLVSCNKHDRSQICIKVKNENTKNFKDIEHSDNVVTHTMLPCQHPSKPKLACSVFTQQTLQHLDGVMEL